MDGNRPNVNDRRAKTAPERNRGRLVLARLRAAINERSHYVFASDVPEARARFRAAVVALLVGGMNEGDLIAAEPDLFVLPERRTVPMSVVAIAKRAIIPDQLVGLVAWLSGTDPLPAREKVRAGHDLFPLADDGARVAGVLSEIARGGLSVFSNAN